MTPPGEDDTLTPSERQARKEWDKAEAERRAREQAAYEARQTHLQEFTKKATDFFKNPPDYSGIREHAAGPADTAATQTYKPPPSDPVRDYAPLGASPRGGDLSKPVVPERGPPANFLQDANGTGGPEPQEGQVRAALEATSQDDAELEATINRVSKLTGQPPAVLRGLGPDEVKRQARELGVLTQTEKTPVLRRKYTEQDFARLAGDDVQPLATIETEIRSLAPQGPADPYTAMANLQRQLERLPPEKRDAFIKASNDRFLASGGLVVQRSPGAAGAGGMDILASGAAIGQGAAEVLDELLRSKPSPFLAVQQGQRGEQLLATTQQGDAPVDPNSPLQRFATWAEAGQKAARAKGDELNPATGDYAADAVLSGIRSSGSSIPWMLAALATGQPELAVAGMSSTTGGLAYAQGREAGLQPFASALYGGTQAMIESLTEKLPVHILLKDITDKTPFGKVLLHQLATEMPTEQAATLLQDATDWAALHPEKTLDEFLAERPSAALQTAIAVAVSVTLQTSVTKAADVAASGMQKLKAQEDSEDKRSKTQIDVANKVLAAATESKTRERDPETFAQTVQDMAKDTPMTHAFIKPDMFASIAASEGKTPEDLAAEFGVGDQVAESLASGAPLQIEFGTYVAKVAAKENQDLYKQNTTYSPFGLTQEEAKALPEAQRERLVAQAEKLAQQTQTDESFAAGVETVRATLEAQLVQAGRFVGEPNRLYSQLAANGYATLATRLGITPEEAFQKFPLSIVGEALTEGSAMRAQSNEATAKVMDFLDQNGDALPLSEIAKQTGVTPQIADRARKAWREESDALSPNNLYDATRRSATQARAQRAKARENYDQVNRGEYSPSTGQLGLLRTADLSTFLHEIGHHFLEVHVAAASNLLERTRAGETLTPNEQELLDDTQSLLTELKVQPGQPGPGQSYAQADTLWALEFFENYIPNATNDDIKALMQKRLDARKLPVVRLFRTTAGRVIAFPAEYSHSEARLLLGDQGLPDADLNMEHSQIRYGQTIEDAHWYDRSGKLTDEQKYLQADTSSFRALRQATPEELSDWYTQNVVETVTERGRKLQVGDDITVTLTRSRKPGVDKYVGYTVDMKFKDRVKRPKTGDEQADKPTPEDVRNAFRTFYKTIAVLQAYVVREQPTFLSFVGSEDSQAKFYDAVLRQADFGYEARIDTLAHAMVGETVQEKYIDKVFLLLRPDIASEFILELSNAEVEKAEFFGEQVLAKRRRITEIIRPANPDRLGGTADGTGDGSSAPASGVLYQGAARRAQPIDDLDIELASKDLTPQQFEAFKFARQGLSNENIAAQMDETGKIDARYVGVLLNQARALGYEIEKVRKGHALSPETLQVIALSAQGRGPKEIAERVYPDRPTDKAAAMVRVLRNRHASLIEQYRRHRSGVLAQGPIFYSALKRAVENSKQKSATAAQWKATLKQTPGVKQEEIEWTGLLDWLDTQEGNISREAVDAFLQENGVKVEEVAFGEGVVNESAVDQLVEIENQLGELYREHGDNSHDWPPGIKNEIAILEDQQDVLRGILNDQKATRFATWTLPGGTDYTELLLTLPGIKGPATHWDEPNVAAHVRFKTRQGADGSRVLAIEEVQSDWHQKGREKGYENPQAQDALLVAHTRQNDARMEHSRLQRQLRQLLEKAPGAHAYEDGATQRWAQRYLDSPEAAPEAPAVRDLLIAERAAHLRVNETTQAVRDAEQNISGIPNAPFKNNGWAALVLKRMIRWAAEHGYDSVAWTPGEVQAERYDLGQVADELQLVTSSDGSMELGVLKDGTEQGSNSITVNSPEHLAEIVGSEVAQKLLNADVIDETPGEYTVRGLKLDADTRVGGTGMLAFYDKILVNEANKLGKKYGAQVGDANIPLQMGSDAYHRAHDSEPKFDARVWHSLPITPELKAQALEGMPLFQPQNDGDLTPEEKAFFRDAVKNPERVLPPGATPLDVWNSLSFAEKTQFHEEFARLTEAYFMEGKAPTPKLRGMFNKFRQWLLNVYKSITDLKVELSDEVRGIMDRMYAASQDIKEANESRSLAPMFTVKPEYMTDTEWQDYQRTNANAVEEAEATLTQRSLRDVKWLSNARSREMKRLQAEAREQRKAVGSEVAAEVAKEKVYIAMNYLKRGIGPDGAPVEPFAAFDPDGQLVTGAPKLSISALETMYANDPSVDIKALGFGKYGMVAKNGMHPDMLAPVLGYQSGDELVRALLSAEPLKERINGLTDQRMLERYGDLVDDASIARAADEAVHSGLRARVLAGEYAALTNALGERKLINEAAQQAAERLVARMPVGKLNPTKFVAQERRAGRASEEALRKNDLAGAAAAKRDQILNFHIAKEVYAKQKERDAAMSKFRIILTAKRDNVAKSRNFDLVQAARAVLASYGMARMKNDVVSYLEAIQRYDPVLYGSLKPTLVNALANSQKITTLETEKFLGLRDVVLQLWDLSREEKLVEINGLKLELDAVTGELGQRLEDLGADGARGITEDPTPWQRALRVGEGMLAALRRVEAWARLVDGGKAGPFTKFLWRPISKAAEAYRSDLTKYIGRFRDLFKPMEATGLDGKKIAAPEIGFTFANKAALLHAVLHTGNESNLRKLLLGRRWGQERADGSLDTSRWDRFLARMAHEGTLTVEDYNFAQGVWDLLEQIKPLAQDAHRRVFGRYFSEVTANTVHTPFGDFRGGYIPAIYDDYFVADQSMKNAQNALEMNDSSMFPAPARGFTQSRVEYNQVMKLDLRLLGSHIDKVLKFAHMAGPVRDAQRIINAKGLSRLLDDFHPTAREDILVPWLVRASRQTNEMPLGGKAGKGASAFANGLRRRSSMGLMFANLVNVVQQPTGLFNALSFKGVKKRYLAQAMARYLRNPTGTHRAVAQASKTIETRSTSQAIAMRDAIDAIVQAKGKYEKAVNWFERHTYFAQTALQNVQDVIVWLGAYESEKSRGSSEHESALFADGVVRQTQGDQAPESISRFETGTGWHKLLVTMYGYFNMWGNQLSTEFRAAVQELGLKKSAGRLVYIYMLGFMAPALLAQLVADAIRGDLPDDDDEEPLEGWLGWFFGTQAKTAAAMVPLAGPAVMAGVNAFNDKPYDDRVLSSPAVSVLETGVRVPLDIYDIVTGDGDASRTVKDTLTLMTLLTGIPFQALSRPLGYAADVLEGDTQPKDAVDAARGLVAGR